MKRVGMFGGGGGEGRGEEGKKKSWNVQQREKSLHSSGQRKISTQHSTHNIQCRKNPHTYKIHSIYANAHFARCVFVFV